MHSRGGRLAATTLSAVVGLAAVVLPFTTSGALSVGSDLGVSDENEETDETLAVIPDGDAELTEVVDGTVKKLEDAVTGAGDDPAELLAPTDESTTTTTTTPAEETQDEVGTSEEEHPSASEERSQVDARDETVVAEQSDVEPGRRVDSVLVRLRALDGTPARPPIVEPTLISYVQPLFDYLDVPRGPRSTRDLVEQLRAVGASQEQIAEVLAPFPVAGPASYGNDWGAPRHGPGPIVRRHEGTDIFAPRGTPVVAAFAGVVSRMGRDTAIGGNSVYLTLPTGDYLYLAHLDAFAPGLREGMSVEPADVLGYVGTTGNALGTPPHVHFEIHPDGGPAVPPLPHLDRWLAQAREDGRAFLATRTGGNPAVGPALGSTGAGQWPPSLTIAQAAARGPASNLASAFAGWLLILAVVAFLVLRRRGVFVGLRRRRLFLRSWPVAGRVAPPWRRRPSPTAHVDVLEALLATPPERPGPLPEPEREGEGDLVLVGAGHGRGGD